MYLAIDTAENDSISLFYTEGDAWKERRFSSNGEVSLLVAIDALVRDLGKSMKDVSGVAARVGKGRFTSTRVAVTVANTLAFTLAVPVVAYEGEEVKHVSELLRNQPVGQYATALYSAPASVGKKNP